MAELPTPEQSFSTTHKWEKIMNGNEVRFTILMVSGPSLTARDRGKTSTGYNISKKSYISFLFLKLLHFRNVQGFQKRKKIKKEKLKNHSFYKINCKRNYRKELWKNSGLNGKRLCAPPSLPDSKWTLQPTELRCHILPAT